jgi:anti-sigma factor (TIGR02949 family)
MDKIDRFTCEDVFRRLDDFVDRELSPHEARLAEEHLRLCSYCAREYQFEASIIRQVRDKVARVAAPPDLMARISAQLSSLDEGGD